MGLAGTDEPTHLRRGRIEQLFELETSDGDQLASGIGRHAREELVKRLLAAVTHLSGDGVILLSDLAFAYPYLQLAPVLDDCTNHIRSPLALVILYPGDIDLEGQLLFLGVRPSGYYRTRDLI